MVDGLVQLWNRLGVDVLVVEALERLVPFEEPEVSTVIAEVFAREGIGVVTGAALTRADRDNTGYRVTLNGADGRSIELRAEQVLVATGDVTGHPQFVYVAAAHGTLVADNAFEAPSAPWTWVTFTSPAIASAGLTDVQAVEQGYACECRVPPLKYVPRALVNRDTHGLIKLVANRAPAVCSAPKPSPATWPHCPAARPDRRSGG